MAQIRTAGQKAAAIDHFELNPAFYKVVVARLDATRSDVTEMFSDRAEVAQKSSINWEYASMAHL
jgi:hypothetical protein